MAGFYSWMTLAAALSLLLVHLEATTDPQFLEISNLIQELKNRYETQINVLTEKIVQQDEKIFRQDEKIAQQDVLIHRLVGPVNAEIVQNVVENEIDLLLNITIEQRAALLEIQLVEIQEDVIDIEEDISILIENDNFLFDEQVIQDERLLNLETETEEIEEEVEDLQTTSADHETRLTAAEENIQGLQATVFTLDARVTALEESAGGLSGNATIAFYAGLTSYTNITTGSNVIFPVVRLNEGNGYDDTTGTFTVPPGGAGYYYFSTNLVADDGELGIFDILVNGSQTCSAIGNSSTVGEYSTATCGIAFYIEDGDEIGVVYMTGTDTTPLVSNSGRFYHGFTGFRI